MKIKRLELKAFGPFTDRVLDFSSDLPGLHVVHGPNEAGKSSSMRALHAWLFGFPHRSLDDFVHSYSQLLLGGCLQSADGRELRFYRRKRQKNDLFDAADSPLSPDVVSSFLHGLAPDTFAAMYGIDHETLVRGGQGILEQQGEVGQTLFAAGAGFSSLKTVLKELEAEGDALYRPRASTSRINQALARYAETQRRVRGASLAGQQWRVHHEALKLKETRLGELQERRGDVMRQLHQLERLRQALPFLAERRQLREQIQSLGAPVSLPHDFSARRQRAAETLGAVRIRLDAALERQKALQAEKGSGHTGASLLDLADVIENVHERLGAYRKGQSDRPRLEGMRIEAKTEAARLLRQIRPDLTLDDAQALRAGLGSRRTVSSLGQQREAVYQALRLAGRRLSDVEEELAALDHGAGPVRQDADPGPLLETVVLARKMGDVDQELVRLRAERDAGDKECAATLQRLGLWTGSLQQVGETALPLAETVDLFDQELRFLDEEMARCRAETQRIETEEQAMERDMLEIEHGGHVPSSAELLACRQRRDQGWGLIRDQWLEGRDVEELRRLYAGDQDLPAAYEADVLQADRTADRMYREADRVRRRAALMADLDAARAQLARLEQAGRATTQKRAETLARWRELWVGCGVEPLLPREMRAWMGRFDGVQRQLADLDKIQTRIVVLEQRRDQVRSQLARCLGENDESGELGPLLARAELRIESLQQARVRAEAMDRKTSELRRDVEKNGKEKELAAQAVQQWESSWAQAMARLGLPPQTLPAEAEDYLEAAQKCLAKLDEVETLRKRRDGIDGDGRDFEQDVAALVARAGLETDAGDPARSVAGLKVALAQAARQQAVQQQQDRELAALEKEMLTLRAQQRRHEDEVQVLRQLAGCEDDAEVSVVEERWMRQRDLGEKLSTVESALLSLAQGQSLDELQTMAEDVDPDLLPARILALREELDLTLEPEIRQVSEDIGQEKSALARMDGGDEAAALNEELQDVLAGVGRMTERFVRFRLAAVVLRQEIERYREQNQDPVLSLASGIFQELTLGAFAGLRADTAPDDRPVLAGVRPGGSWVQVEGMSSGTRDQLYLALRLATLDLRASSAEPMPFVVDDILINFDEPRSEATLKVMARMAESMQIIMFTHQRLVADMAERLNMADRIFVHHL